MTIKSILQTLVIFIFFSALYISTAPQTNVSYADSDLMITIGHFAGVAHPPGYPLYMLLLYGITNLAIPGTVAFRAHILSALLHAATLVVIYLAIKNLIFYFLNKNLLNFLQKKKQFVSIFVAILSTASLGFSYLFWLYSSVAEKYPLNDLFAALIFYFVIKIHISKSETKTLLWFLLSVVFSLSLAHHHSVLMLTPGLALLAWQNRADFIKSLKFTIPTSLIIYGLSIVLLLWLNSHSAPVSWHFEPTLNGLFRHLTRREFTGYNIVQGEYRGIYLDPVGVDEIISKIPIYADLLLKHFGIYVITLFVFGVFIFPKLDKKLSQIFTLFMLGTTVFIPMYVDWPNDLSIQSLRIRMYLFGYIVIPIFISISLYRLAVHITNNKRIGDRLKKITLLFIALPILFQSVIIYPQVDLKKTTYIHDLYENILTSVPKDSLVTCISDVSCFALLYTKHVEGLRPDVVVLPHGSHLVEHSLPKNSDLKGFDYIENPDKFIDYITWNLGKRNVYVVELQEIYSKLLGLNYGLLYYTPHGYYGEITKYRPAEVPNYDSKFSEKISAEPLTPLDHSRLQFRAQLAQKHLLNTITYARLGLGGSLLERELELARSLSKGLPDIYTQEIAKVDRLLSSPQNFDIYVAGKKFPTPKEILIQAQFYSDQGQKNTALIGINSLLYQNPTNPEIRLHLAKFYRKNSETQKALEEIANILKYNPTYQPALTFRDEIISDPKY